MKVEIASCYYHHNYGSMLQAYATQEIIKQLGYETETIRCLSPIHYMTQSAIKYYGHKLQDADIVRKKMRQFKGKIDMRRNPEFRENLKIRDEYFEKFYTENIQLSSLCHTRSDLSSVCEGSQAVVVGSDMLWHPVNVEHDYYTLTFVPESIKRVSYATSFGTTKIPRYQVEKYIEFLSKFHAISVRETSGIKLINELGIRVPATVVLDPTLLFTSEDWLKIQNLDPIIDEDYVFCYYLGTNREHRLFAEKIKKETGYKIVALKHLDEYVKDDEEFGDISPFDVGPAEFINLIRNAKYVCTDSFHGTCFSILNHKKFFVMNRFLENNTQSTNTRIDSLLSVLSLSERRVFANDSREIKHLISSEVDYGFVDEILKKLRFNSIDYLDKAIK